MRFTIERIRTLVLVAAVLLVAAIVVFFGVAKFHHPFSRRDVPARLGIDIQEEANGVTYTQAHGGHTLFKIHASRVVQLRNNHATLHDVVIELYGKDGARVDRIQGAEFEYDQETGIAAAKGTVQIDMQRPTAGGQQAGAKPNPNDAIRVRTSGITFNQGTGIVATNQHVEFASGQGSGSAQGASYDSDLGFLVLNRDVALTTVHGVNPVTLRAVHAVFNRDTQLCTLNQATIQTRGDQATATDARISFRQDGSVEHIDASSGLTVATHLGSRMAAPVGAIDFTAANLPRVAHLEGGVTIDSSSAGRTLHGAAPIMNLDFTARGDLHHAHLERGVEIRSHEQSQAAANSTTQIERTWHSPVADIDFRNAGSGQIEPASLRGVQGVVVTSETRRTGAVPVPSRLAADNLTAQFGPHSTLTSMTGQGHAAIDQTAATGARQTATGDRLDAHFSATSPTANRITSPASSQPVQLQTAQLDGHVVLVDQPAGKPGTQPQPPLRATAGRAQYEAVNAPATAEQWLHLTINPRVTNGGIDLTAVKIDIAQSSGDAFAHGNVKATWVNENSANGGAPQAVALGGQSPAHVVAAEAQLRQSTGEATFRGHARLWQDQNSISAPVIVLNRQQQTLVAQAAGAAAPVLSALLTAEAAPTQRAGAKSSTRAPSVVRVRSGDLRYFAQDRKALLHAAPLASVIAETSTAESASDQLELYLTPAGAAHQNASSRNAAANPSQIDRIVALGHVAVTSQGRRGTGAQLVYTAQTGNYVLTGTPSALPRMTDPQRGSVTGESLLFNSRDDSVSIEGGTQPTTTQTTAPR